MTDSRKRRYSSALRTESAEETRKRILDAARALFSRRGIDAVTIAEVARKARASASSVYAIYKSKEGILRALMTQSIFGAQYQVAQARFDEVSDPVRLIEMTAEVAAAIWGSEANDLGLLRHASGLSLALRQLEQEFEETRYAM